ncbi:hypothetical protein E2C01_091989 [Portunus trituberculatus]|uniref:Uncharacterized protein n=1 Tax=Portunus trituberculatus TaxID=210409 RepID=A0A5B7JWK7_PORTR|nr:hypothetical protein [Portunus trituberculatus]
MIMRSPQNDKSLSIRLTCPGKAVAARVPHAALIVAGNKSVTHFPNVAQGNCTCMKQMNHVREWSPLIRPERWLARASHLVNIHAGTESWDAQLWRTGPKSNTDERDTCARRLSPLITLKFITVIISFSLSEHYTVT